MKEIQGSKFKVQGLGIKILAATIALLMVFAMNAFAGEVKIGGGAPPIGKAITPIKEPFQKATGITINALTYGPKFAIIDLEKDAIEAAVLFLTMEEVMGLAKKENIEIKDSSSYQQAVIGNDNIVIIVNKDNPIKSLSNEQVKDIFSGKITNWKDVGGKDMPIIIVWGKLIKGVNDLFERKIMGGQSITKELLEVDSAVDVKQSVSSNAEAIGLASVGILDATIKALEKPGISVPIILYTKGKPSANVQKLLDFVQGEGKKYIK
jgi:phosphate transport system substrate-binding protein